MPHSNLLFKQNPNPMFVFDRETHKIEEVNQSAIEKYGYSADEFRELRIEDIRAEKDASSLRRAFATLSVEHDPQVIGTHRQITKDGEIFHARITTQPASSEGGSKWIAHIFDISEIVEVKQHYREASQELKNHIDANPLALIKFDEAFNISQWSSSACKLSGYSEPEMIGKNPLETGFIVDEEKERLAERMNRIKERKNPQAI
ncbi:MAG: PAS domain-containing protein [Balneolaceae bacterium]|nr:PAS domain-containing protein [Balneolaceae bacterium]